MAHLAIEPTEVAYFAGFFDGEGSVGAYPKYGVYRASLTNTDVRALRRARELWGGAILCQTAATRARMSHPSRRDTWRWELAGHSARDFLEAIRPFVKLKGDQIDTYLAMLDVLPRGRGVKRQPGATGLITLAANRLRLLKMRGIA